MAVRGLKKLFMSLSYLEQIHSIRFRFARVALSPAADQVQVKMKNNLPAAFFNIKKKFVSAF